MHSPENYWHGQHDLLFSHYAKCFGEIMAHYAKSKPLLFTSMSLNVSLPGALLDWRPCLSATWCLRVQGKTEMLSIESYVGRCPVGPKSGPNNERQHIGAQNEKVNLRVLEHKSERKQWQRLTQKLEKKCWLSPFIFLAREKWTVCFRVSLFF